MKALCVSIHDVSPATFRECALLADALHAVDPAMPLTLLVIPRHHAATRPDDRRYLAWLDARVARGDELALHGYTHADDAAPAVGVREYLRRCVYTAGEGEYAAIGYDDAMRRLECGLEWFRAHHWTATGFVAPAWLLSADAWRALRDIGLSYSTTLTRFHWLAERRDIRAPTVVCSTRSLLRRIASHAWNRLLVFREDDATLLRIGLHPADACYPDVLWQLLKIVESERKQRVAMTKREFAGMYTPANAVRPARRAE